MESSSLRRGRSIGSDSNAGIVDERVEASRLEEAARLELLDGVLYEKEIG